MRPLLKFLSVIAALLSVAALYAQSPKNSTTPPRDIQAPPGFKVELLHSALPDEGSWVCMTVDDKGHFIIAPQNLNSPEEGSLWRVTLGTNGLVQKFERVPLPIHEAQGLLYTNGALYVVVNKYKGQFDSGLYRLTDTNGDDQLDKIELLKKIDGSGEHGPHAVVAGPDKQLYIVCGNDTRLPKGIAADSPHKNFADDQLLPQKTWPANYTWANSWPPGSFVARTDLDGKNWTLLCAGLRNAYDIAFNREGEMFTFDSDMDWDEGAPWYRPTRISHLVSGGEYGWRRGTGKWPDYYPDSLHSTLDIGRSSPTGVKFGTGATNFPPRFRRQMFMCDWAFGTIYAATFTPSGASYKASAEPFLTGRPLNVTDLEFGADGAMYFITGGRGTASGLYRVTYQQPMTRDPIDWSLEYQQGVKARKLRHELEVFHGRHNVKAIDVAWPHLDSDDRSLRYAARIAIEWQDVSLWQQRALDETHPTASIHALLALARCGGKAAQGKLFEALGRLKGAELDEEQTLDALRVLGLSFIRQGKPDADVRTRIAGYLDSLYPTKSPRVNRELCQLLVYLDAPGVVAKSLALLAEAPRQEEQLQYAFPLRLMRTGWTSELREKYFRWFSQTAANYKGSSKVLVFLADTRRDAIATLSGAEKASLGKLLEEKLAAAPPSVTLKARPFVKEWKMDDLLPALDEVGRDRSFERGKEMFTAVQCILCHRFSNQGGAIGPDLSSVGSRFNRYDILEAMLLPSKVVSDQFQNMVFVKKDGDDVTGPVVEENDERVVVLTNPLADTRVIVSKSEIKEKRVSTLSPMPEGLLNALSREEILDLIAYLESGGNANYAAFKK